MKKYVNLISFFAILISVSNAYTYPQRCSLVNETKDYNNGRSTCDYTCEDGSARIRYVPSDRGCDGEIGG